jgi:hypothetical protein
MTPRTTVLATLIAVLLLLGTATALAAPRDDRAGGWSTQAMHGSEMMRVMHAELPPELAAQCDELHAAMGEHMDDMPMRDMPMRGMGDVPMGGMPMGGMPGDHAAHHPRR